MTFARTRLPALVALCAALGAGGLARAENWRALVIANQAEGAGQTDAQALAVSQALMARGYAVRRLRDVSDATLPPGGPAGPVLIYIAGQPVATPGSAAVRDGGGLRLRSSDGAGLSVGALLDQMRAQGATSVVAVIDACPAAAADITPPAGMVLALPGRDEGCADAPPLAPALVDALAGDTPFAAALASAGARVQADPAARRISPLADGNGATTDARAPSAAPDVIPTAGLAAGPLVLGHGSPDPAPPAVPTDEPSETQIPTPETPPIITPHAGSTAFTAPPETSAAAPPASAPEPEGGAPEAAGAERGAAGVTAEDEGIAAAPDERGAADLAALAPPPSPAGERFAQIPRQTGFDRSVRSVRPGMPRPTIIIGELAPTAAIDPALAGRQLSVADRRALRDRDPAAFARNLAAGLYDPPAEAVASAIQSELAAMGCYGATVDGVWGNGSRQAVARYVAAGAKAAAQAGREPDIALFRAIAGADRVTCPSQRTATTPARSAPATTTRRAPQQAARVPATPRAPASQPQQAARPRAPQAASQQPTAPTRNTRPGGGLGAATLGAGMFR